MICLTNRLLLQPFMAWKSDSPHLKYLRALERTQYDPPEMIAQRPLVAWRETVRPSTQTVP